MICPHLHIKMRISNGYFVHGDRHHGNRQGERERKQTEKYANHKYDITSLTSTSHGRKSCEGRIKLKREIDNKS